MQVDELRWFTVLAERQHMTATARELHVSQPALSRSLQRLETTLGVALFDRRGRVLRLNAHGARYLQHVRRALEELDAGEAAVRDAVDAERGEVRLYFLLTLGSWLLPELIGAYRAEHPRVRFVLHQTPTGSALAALDAGECDLVLMGPRPVGERFAWQPLVTEPLLLAVPPGHRLAARRRVRLAEVADEPFIAIRRDNAFRDLTDSLCRAAGFEPRIAFEGDEIATLRGLVAAGLGVALLTPSRVAAEEVETGTPHLRVQDAGAHRELGLVWLRDRPRTAAVETFRRFVVERGRDVVS